MTNKKTSWTKKCGGACDLNRCMFKVLDMQRGNIPRILQNKRNSEISQPVEFEMRLWNDNSHKAPIFWPFMQLYWQYLKNRYRLPENYERFLLERYTVRTRATRKNNTSGWLENRQERWAVRANREWTIKKLVSLKLYSEQFCS